MSNIVFTPIDGWVEENGAHVSFKSPCDCSVAGNLVIGENSYSIVDACGNVLTGKSGAFVSGVVLDFILDKDNLKAYLQNAASTQGDFVTAGANNGGAISTFCNSHPSYIGTFYQRSDSTWYNLISCRHENGRRESDGHKYGMYFYNGLFGGDLKWKQQTNADTYGADRTIWDSGNSLQTAAGGGNDSAYIRVGNFQICWGAFAVTMDVNTATGSSYYGEWTGDVSFAQPFASSCYPNISLTSESTLIKSIELEQRSYTGIQKILVFDSRPRTSQFFPVHYIACGFWQ